MRSSGRELWVPEADGTGRAASQRRTTLRLLPELLGSSRTALSVARRAGASCAPVEGGDLSAIGDILRGSEGAHEGALERIDGASQCIHRHLIRGVESMQVQHGSLTIHLK